jgi:DNA polymerase-3 subunit gamma/tau
MNEVLYNKYRPKTYEDVIGQDIAIRILKNSVAFNKINHAYLFYGTRGTGKTTLARIFSKAVNCTNPNNGEPCNVCESCIMINDNKSIDIIEIDAASNNGVDEIRTLTENANYTTSFLKNKVYIIDEVHMLSKAAFNALLKTLEEPPSNTLFLMATTEINKIPDTILSRVVVINLNLINSDSIKNLLINMVKSEQLTYEDSSLSYIAELSKGSVRDAISMLQTVILYDDNLTEENTITSLGIIKKSFIHENLLVNNALIYEKITNEKNPKRILIQLIDDLMAKEVLETEEISMLDRLIEGYSIIKDPVLLIDFLRIILRTNDVNEAYNHKNISFIHDNDTNVEVIDDNKEDNVSKNDDVSHETLSINKDVFIEEKPSSEENMPSINDGAYLSDANDEPINNETGNEIVSHETITDFIGAKEYISLILSNDKTLKNKISLR